MVRRHTFHRSLFATAALALLAAASLSAAEPRLIKIKGTDAMQYDVKKIEAKPGETLKVQLSTVSAMGKAEMAHNFTLLTIPLAHRLGRRPMWCQSRCSPLRHLRRSCSSGSAMPASCVRAPRRHGSWANQTQRASLPTLRSRRRA